MYKNDIVIGLTKCDLDSILEVLPFSNFNIEMRQKNYCYLVLTDVMWHPEYEPTQSILINELMQLGSDNYCFVRLGDEVDDNEIHGNAYRFNMGIQRSIIYGEELCK